MHMPSTIVQELDQKNPLYKGVFDLREKILRQPLGLSLHNEDLSEEAGDSIFAAVSDGTVIGCVMLRPAGSSKLKLRQMAVDGTLQQKGIGRLLVEAAEAYGRDNNFKQIVLHARKHAIGFYEKLGYQTEGPEFEEVGIAHMLMQKLL